jgi:hypothetical protein
MHDTLNSNTLQPGMSDDSLDNMDDDPIIDSAGKEDLGGGVGVGITSTLLDGQVAFGRTAPRTGAETITTGGSATQLIAGAATLITDSCQRGDWVINWTDRSVTEVLEVQSESQARCRALSGGVTNLFNVNDVITVWEVTEAELSGGNTVAVDAADLAINPLFTTFGRFATRASSSSATIQNQESLEAAAFQGGVAYKPGSGNVGTVFPNGTREFPLQSIMDVLAVSQARGLRKIFVMADANLSAMTMDMSADQHLWIGDNRNITLTLSSGGTMNVTNNGFENLTLVGHTGGNNSFLRCDMLDTSSIGGHATSCEFTGETTIIGDTDLESCFSGETGTGHPDFLINSGSTLQVSDWHRGFGIHQAVDGVHTIEIYGGQFHVGAGATGGTFHLRGMPSKPADDQSAGATIIDETGITHIWDYVQASSRTSGELLNLLNLIYDRLDLNASKPNVYNNDGSKITGTDFTLKKTVVGLTSTVQRL